MNFLTNFIATITIFLTPLFSGLGLLYQQQVISPTTNRSVSIASQISKDAPNTITTASERAVKTTTSKVTYLKNNNLYINSKLVAKDIPSILGLPPSSLGQDAGNPNFPQDGFSTGGANFTDNSTTGSTDIYSGLATSSLQDGLVSFIYEREKRATSDTYWPTVSFATILTYSEQGLVSRFDLTPNNPSYANLSKKSGLLFSDGADLSLIAKIIYVDRNNLYFTLNAGKDSALFDIYRISGGSIHYLFTTSVGIYSPDNTQIAFTSEPESLSSGIYSCEGGLGNSNKNKVDILDFPNATIYPVTQNKLKFYKSFYWSNDGSLLLMTEGIPTGKDAKGNLCIRNQDNVEQFLTYNTITKTRKENALSSQQSLILECQSGGYVCSEQHSFLN